jgi:hypothetical protein
VSCQHDRDRADDPRSDDAALNNALRKRLVARQGSEKEPGQQRPREGKESAGLRWLRIFRYGQAFAGRAALSWRRSNAGRDEGLPFLELESK